MAATVDHVFVFTRRDAPERERLLQRGLQIGRERAHEGQGTQNVCFGFADSFLELIWLADEKGAREPMVKPLGLLERSQWRDYRASPFGLCLRTEPGEAVPFAHWDYRPRYLPEGKVIDMGCNSGVIGEPLLFRAPSAYEPLTVEHALSQHRLQRVRITTPELAPMSLLHDLQLDGVEFANGGEHLMELTLGESGQELDLRPELPLVLRW